MGWTNQRQDAPGSRTLNDRTQHQNLNIPESRDYKAHIIVKDQGFPLKESYKA